MTPMDSRGIVEPWVLTIATTLAPCSRAWRTAMIVSIVSRTARSRRRESFGDDRIAVAELWAVVDPDRDTAPVLMAYLA